MLGYIKALFCTAMRDRKGITAMEYGILAAAILAVTAAAASTMSTNLGSLFGKIESDL